MDSSLQKMFHIVLPINKATAARSRVPSHFIKFSSEPDEFRQYRYWQYGNLAHSSQKRKIVGSVLFYDKMASDITIFISNFFVSRVLQ